MTSTTETTAVETVKLSAEEKLAAKIAKLSERIAADTAALESAQAELDALLALANLSAGQFVTATVGRGENAREVVARVLGVQETEAGRRIKVQVGEGFETEVFVLLPTQVTGVVSADPVVSEPAQDLGEVANLGHLPGLIG